MKGIPILRVIACCAGIAVGAVPGCGWIYRMDITQGNWVDEDQIQKLKPGMSEAQVRTLLGTPLVANPFRPDRWQYYFYWKGAFAKTPEVWRLEVTLKDGQLERVEEFEYTPAPASAP